MLHWRKLTGSALESPVPVRSVIAALSRRSRNDHVAISDEPLARLIPQREAKRANALRERDHGDVVKERVLVVALRERVVRDARSEVMDVVQTDAAGEPVQHRRQACRYELPRIAAVA